MNLSPSGTPFTWGHWASEVAACYRKHGTKASTTATLIVSTGVAQSVADRRRMHGVRRGIRAAAAPSTRRVRGLATTSAAG